MDERNRDDAEWAELGALWRSREVPAIDLAAVEREAAAYTRRMRAMIAMEVLSVPVAIGVTVKHLITQPRMSAFEWTLIVLLFVLLGYTGWGIWMRHRLRGADASGPQALVELQIRRAHNAKRYWRVSSVVTVAMWLALAALAAAEAAGWQITARAGNLWLSVAAVFPLVLGSLWFERWRVRRLDADIRRLDEILQQLRT
ncbi:hypothetical protein ACFFGH_00260 [Lysobacter korlensis]|uniref:Transmembrane protein n=1 Tax=Lysobacter korlensis TaxID=553636 RepID=A0ABV6RH15_9GAMM